MNIPQSTKRRYDDDDEDMGSTQKPKLNKKRIVVRESEDELQKVLNIDHQSRENDYSINPNFDLIPFENVIPGKILKIPYPILQRFSGDNDRKYTIKKMSSSEIAYKLYSRYPFLKDIQFKNIVIAGGSISAAIIDYNYHGLVDLDIFFYGLQNTDEAINVFNFYLYTFIDVMKKMYKNIKFDFIKSKNCFTLIGKLDPYDYFGETRYRTEFKVQFIFRLYKSISEIIHGFDLGSSAIAFDGTNVFVSSLGKFAFEYQSNIIDPTRRSTTYEQRLAKYFNRQFKIIAPDLNIDRIKKKSNNLDFEDYNDSIDIVKNLKGSHIRINNNIITLALHFGNEDGNIKSDYLFTDNVFSATIYNINLLMNGKPNPSDFIYSNKQHYYDNEPIPETNENMTTEEIVNQISSLPILIYKKVLYSELVYSFGEEFKNHILNLMSRGKIPTLKDVGVEWITKNPGTQLTGSFNPIIEDPREFYMSNYKKWGEQTTGSSKMQIFEDGKIYLDEDIIDNTMDYIDKISESFENIKDYFENLSYYFNDNTFYSSDRMLEKPDFITIDPSDHSNIIIRLPEVYKLFITMEKIQDKKI